jgi:16S rRNA (cytosine1402-N4)-methyltransferase
MVAEVLGALEPRTGGAYVDGTVGGGGHAEAILKASAPDGRLYGCDRDGAAVEAARRRLAPWASRFEIRQGTFGELESWLRPESCDGALLDLGVSSPQLDEAERGFSFQQDGPLDMRMDTRQSRTAAGLVNEASAEELARLFRDLGGERHALRLARAIEQERSTAPLETTGQLARLIERVLPRRGARIHPATRVFQALRIAVNDELNALAKGLEVVCRLLRRQGRLVVITFHSGEDRLVKAFGRERVRDYEVPGGVDVPALRRPIAPQARWISRKAVQPSPAEQAENPRSRSAQLRVLEKMT